MNDRRTNQAVSLTDKFNKKYGDKSAITGNNHINLDVVPTGSLMLDYALGTGGWPLGKAVEVYGVNHLGKTSIIGYSALREAQAMGLLTAIIAIEPDFDEDWASKWGVDPELNLVLRPDNGEEAFTMLKDLVEDGTVGYILFDSLGGISSDKEIDSDKPQAYGNSAMITWGVKRVIMRAFKNNVGIMYINQVRDDTKSRVSGLLDSPGGHALHHAVAQRIHLKPGKDRYTIRVNNGESTEDFMIGRQLVATFKKNKAGKSISTSARFDAYFKEIEGYPFGIDIVNDTINVAKVSGVFEGAGAWIRYEHFPDGKLQGRSAAASYISDKPEIIKQIRQDVLKVMMSSDISKGND